MNPIKGLISLSKPLESNIDASRNKIEKIGAKSLLPGSINQKAPNIPIKIGVKKNFINLFEVKFIKINIKKNKNK